MSWSVRRAAASSAAPTSTMRRASIRRSGSVRPVCGLAVHRRADERLQRGPLVDRVDVRPAAALHAHDVLGAQRLDRLADGEAAHPCLARQLALRR